MQLVDQKGDGCRTFMSFLRTGESNDPGAHQLRSYMALPRVFKYVYYLWVKFVKRDPLWADLLACWHERSSFEQWQLVARREAYKASWHAWWNSDKFDFLLTPVNATPAVPHGGMKEMVSSCGYTFLFNLVSLQNHSHMISGTANNDLAGLHMWHPPSPES